MENLNLKIASKLLKVAKELIADSDYEYIYDPEHRKHPGGGYIKTEKGWQKGKQNKKENQSQQLKNHLVKQLNIPEQDIQQMKEAEKYLKVECDGKPVNREVAKKILGDAYWHGLNRAAFHWTGTPSTDDGHEWHFDCRSYFRQEKKPRQTSWKKTVQNLVPEVKEKMLQDKKCPSKILDALADEYKLKVALHPNTSAETLDKLANDTDQNVRNSVALNSNTSAETLDKLSEDKDEWIRRNVAMNPNTSSKTLGKLDDDKSDVVYHAVTSNPNAERQQLEYIYDRIMDGYEEDKKNSGKSTLQGAKFKSDNWALTNIAKHPNAKGDTLDQLVQKFPKGTEIGDAARANLKSRGITDYEEDDNKAKKLPKYKFKGDDKTQAIIRKKFGKDEDKEETDTIYGEMAKFSRDDAAPMGTYHGRTKDQLKADFIKNMDPSNYASPQSFKKAQERIRKLSAQDFSRMLASIFADEEQEI